VETHSAAAKAGIQPGDRIVSVNGQPNSIIVDLFGMEPNQLRTALSRLDRPGIQLLDQGDGRLRFAATELSIFLKAKSDLADLTNNATIVTTDRLNELVRDWPRGKAQLVLGVERSNEVIQLPAFTPRTVGLYPTQLYETLSMVLTIFFLLAYYPYRRHDGQLFVLLMLVYSIHRFLNESLRIEPTVGFGLTLSQWGSVVILVSAVAIEAYLWRVMPSRWKRSTSS
jgi:hypothetical protein